MQEKRPARLTRAGPVRQVPDHVVSALASKTMLTHPELMPGSELTRHFQLSGLVNVSASTRSTSECDSTPTVRFAMNRTATTAFPTTTLVLIKITSIQQSSYFDSEHIDVAQPPEDVLSAAFHPHTAAGRPTVRIGRRCPVNPQLLNDSYYGIGRVCR